MTKKFTGKSPDFPTVYAVRRKDANKLGSKMFCFFSSLKKQADAVSKRHKLASKIKDLELLTKISSHDIMAIKKFSGGITDKDCLLFFKRYFSAEKTRDKNVWQEVENLKKWVNFIDEKSAQNEADELIMVANRFVGKYPLLSCLNKYELEDNTAAQNSLVEFINQSAASSSAA